MPMDENAMRQWLIECFGPIQGEMAWNQLSQLPQDMRDQLMAQSADKLPNPEDIRTLMQSFASGGLNSVDDMRRTVEEGPINVRLATSIALRQANEGAQGTVSAEEGELARRAISEANLWLDTACSFDPASGDMHLLTRAGWVEATLNAWARFAAPVAQSMNTALASVIGERFGDSFGGEVSGMFAGPIPIPLPDGMKDPTQLMRLLGNTSFAMQLGHAAGDLSHEVRGSFDQGIALLSNPAGALIVQNAVAYAESLQIDTQEALSFLALQEAAHARLFVAVPWLMPRFEALIGKYARGIAIDLDAMEEQLREATAMDPESISGAVNITKVAVEDTPEQRQALSGLENLLALVEGWVDCVTWKAGMAHVPHIEQLREMLRRERAVGGPAQRTFESLLGLDLRPKRVREAAALWERLGVQEGGTQCDSHWSHPDMLPMLPTESSSVDAADGAGSDSRSSTSATQAIDWDAELSRLLSEGDHDDSDHGDGDGHDGKTISGQDGEDSTGDGGPADDSTTNGGNGSDSSGTGTESRDGSMGERKDGQTSPDTDIDGNNGRDVREDGNRDGNGIADGRDDTDD